MIRGIETKPVPYVLEDDRGSAVKDQTIFFITPKRGADANKTVARYAAASKDGRQGYREINTAKLDDADVQEFLATVLQVKNFGLSSSHKDLVESKDGIVTDTSESLILTAICQDLSPAHLTEIFDASSNPTQLEKGRYKGK